jgi:hypothetical protein
MTLTCLSALNELAGSLSSGRPVSIASMDVAGIDGEAASIVTKRQGPRAAGLAQAFRLTWPARARWHAVNAPRLAGLIRARVCLERGVLAARRDQAAG